MRTMFMGSGSNLFLRKSVVDEINGYDESFKRNQDIEFLVRVSERYKIAHINEALLIIHQEGERQSLDFDKTEKTVQHYLNKFDSRINNLNKREKNRVIAVISLERFRLALYSQRYMEGIKILVKNKVSPIFLIRYLKYLCHRCITHKSYGFNGK